MDTNVFLGALWSTHGAAFEVLQQLRANRWQLLLSNHLLLEYEEVAKRYAAEMELTLGDIDDVLDAICTTAEQRQLKPDWTPHLPDPDDEPLLQLAVEAGADCIVTRNPGQTHQKSQCSGHGRQRMDGSGGSWLRRSF